MIVAPQWRLQRKLIQPTFNAKILNTFMKVFDNQSKVLASKMKRYLNGPEFELFDLLALALLDMLCGIYIAHNTVNPDSLYLIIVTSHFVTAETLMDVEIGAQTNAELPFVDALRT